MRFVSGLFKIIVGIIFGLLAALALSPAVAAFEPETGGKSSLLMIAVVLVSTALAFLAPTVRRAFGRGFLLAGVSFLALPLSVMMLSGRVANDAITTAASSSQASTAIGAGLAGVAMTGAAAFIGLILGGIFIIIGLVLALGGRREVTIIAR